MKQPLDGVEFAAVVEPLERGGFAPVEFEQSEFEEEGGMPGRGAEPGREVRKERKEIEGIDDTRDDAIAMRGGQVLIDAKPVGVLMVPGRFAPAEDTSLASGSRGC